MIKFREILTIVLRLKRENKNSFIRLLHDLEQIFHEQAIETGQDLYHAMIKISIYRKTRSLSKYKHQGVTIEWMQGRDSLKSTAREIKFSLLADHLTDVSRF